MAEIAKTQQSRLTPTPKALDKALVISAQRAHRLAKAFGQKVPGITRPVKTVKRKA
jgi:hypothetical protein